MLIRGLIVLGLSFSSDVAFGQTCPLESSFQQPTPSAAKTVRYDKDKLVFQASFRVDTDGNIRSYSAVDPTGTRCGTPPYIHSDPFASGCAMDSLCDGLTMYGPGKGDQRPRYDNNQCRALLATFQRYRDAHYNLSDGTAVAKSSIEVHTDGPLKGQPCETKEGFLVSNSSALSGLPGGSCVQAQFLDSAVPYIAVPKCWSKDYRTHDAKAAAECRTDLPQAEAIDVRPGDLVALRDAAGRDAPVFAVLGDLGPNHKLGEASIGLHMALKGRATLPRTIAETNAYDDGMRFDVVIFRNTSVAGRVITPATFVDLKHAASDLFSNLRQDGLSGEQILQACGGSAP